jgi:hypothetical protein
MFGFLVGNGQVSIEPNSKSLQAFHMKKRAKLKLKNYFKGTKSLNPKCIKMTM